MLHIVFASQILVLTMNHPEIRCTQICSQTLHLEAFHVYFVFSLEAKRQEVSPGQFNFELAQEKATQFTYLARLKQAKPISETHI